LYARRKTGGCESGTGKNEVGRSLSVWVGEHHHVSGYDGTCVSRVGGSWGVGKASVKTISGGSGRHPPKTGWEYPGRGGGPTLKRKLVWPRLLQRKLGQDKMARLDREKKNITALVCVDWLGEGGPSQLGMSGPGKGDGFGPLHSLQNSYISNHIH